MNNDVTESDYNEAASRLLKECENDLLFKTLFKPIDRLCRVIISLKQPEKDSSPSETVKPLPEIEKKTLISSVKQSLTEIREKAKLEQEKRLKERLSKLK